VELGAKYYTKSFDEYQGRRVFKFLPLRQKREFMSRMDIQLPCHLQERLFEALCFVSICQVNSPRASNHPATEMEYKYGWSNDGHLQGKSEEVSLIFLAREFH